MSNTGEERTNMVKENARTPIKSKSGLCVVCGVNGKHQRVIHSEAGRTKRLGEMLHEYIGIVVAAGSLCRDCEGRLLTIEKKVSSMKGKSSEL